MMNVLFDADVILDVLLDREPYEITSYKLLTLVEKGYITGWIGSGTVNTLYYLMAGELEHKWVKRHLIEVLELFTIIPVTGEILEKSIKSSFLDFEDAVLCHAAEAYTLDYIITRNKVNFKGDIPVYAPEELLNILEALR
ncbi:MAG: PIN domain-containing protein [Balneolales bacterium]